ncbi:MAG TPA: YggS family pyridoxal phosphate-dependent enzyme [bacterium]|nr:YggS family pyridoxal phosphate-dependent enzyme [bacterium]
MELQTRLLEIRERIAQAAVRSGRAPDAVVLLAVTKTFPPETIRQAYDLGLRLFGENRVQEAIPKIDGLPGDIQWHLIGQLQTNKINKVIGKFALVQSVDSLKLAQALSARLSGGHQDVLLEVNTSGEDSKSGTAPDRALEEAGRISSLPGLRLRGLMTVGPLTDDRMRQRESFKRLKGLFDALKTMGIGGDEFSVLSMGMSGDFEAAIEEGATLVRIGSSLFGRRS